jgi:predicted HAD superfamily Cof-like phosphohydrolase
MVQDWHRKNGVLVNVKPTLITDELMERRLSLFTEEIEEPRTAIESRNLIAIADAIADVLYVMYGTAVAYGIDMEPVFQEIHRSNMTKEGLTPQGKGIKGRNYHPPNLAPIIKLQLA